MRKPPERRARRQRQRLERATFEGCERRPEPQDQRERDLLREVSAMAREWTGDDWR